MGTAATHTDFERWLTFANAHHYKMNVAPIVEGKFNECIRGFLAKRDRATPVRDPYVHRV
jgi:hypothetical protein